MQRNLTRGCPTCAFTTPLVLNAHPAAQGTLSKSPYLTPHRPVHIRPPHVSKRRRVTPLASVRNTRDDDIQAKAADFLLSTGRFFQTGTGQAVLWGGLVWLIITGRIGVLFDSFLILLVVVSIVPVVAIIVFRWWVGRQLVQGTCPNCGADVTGLRGQPFQCAACGTILQGDGTGSFSVNDPTSATIDIDATEINDN